MTTFRVGNVSRTNLASVSTFPMWNANKISDISVHDFTAITDGQVMTFDQSINEWVAKNIPISPPPDPSGVANVLQVAIPAESGQYSSITSAMTAITDNNAITPYVISVAPGIYTEENIIIKEYVSVVGISAESVIVQGNIDVPVFTAGNNTTLSNITIKSLTTLSSPLVKIENKTNVYVSNIIFKDAKNGIFIGPSTSGEKTVIMNEIQGSNITDTTLTVDGTGTSTTQLILNTFKISNLSLAAIKIFGSNALANIFSGCIEGNTTGIGINIYNGANTFVSNICIRNEAIGVSDVGGGTGPNIICSATKFDNVPLYIQILNAATIGHADGYIGLPNANINANSSFFLTQVPNLIIFVEKKGGAFMTVNAAINYINALSLAPSVTQQYTIQVGSGNFIEAPFTIPKFVQITGVDIEETTLSTSNNSSDFITMNSDTAIRDMTIIGPTGLFNSINFTGATVVTTILGSITVENVQLRGAGNSLISVNSNTGSAVCYFRRLTLIPPFTVGILINNTVGPISRIVLNQISLTNSGALLSPLTGVRTMGNNTIQLVVANIVAVDQANTGQVTMFQIDSGGLFIMTDMLTNFLRSTVTINNSVLIPTVNILSSLMLNPNTNSMIINNANALGSVNAVTPRVSISFVAGTAINIFTQSPNTGSISVSGNIQQGPSIEEITNISTSIQQSCPLGVITGGIMTNTGLNISVTAGTGYLMSSLGSLKFLTWGVLSISISANLSRYIFITENIALQSSATLPDITTNILIGFVKTGSSSVDFYQKISEQAVHTTQLLDVANRNALGPIYSSGSATSNGSSARSFNVTSGTYYYGTHVYMPSGASPVNITGYYGSNSSVAPFTQLATPFQYDVAGVLTNVTAAQFVKHTLYVVNDGSDEKYILVYAQAQYASSALAQAAALAIPPSFISGNVVQIAGIVVQGGAAVIDAILDIRPIGFRTLNAGTTPADHQTLTNRADPTAHSQYYLKSGDTMTGTLNMNTNTVINATTYNGVTIEAHASRHLPGGADPLATAAPVNIGTANAIGIAASFSRSDHVHNHGAQTDPTFHAAVTTVNNGFMSAADKVKLNASTSTPTANVIVQYNASLGLNSRDVNLFSSGIFTGNQSGVVLYDSVSNNVNNIRLRAPDSATSYTLTLPQTVGLSGQILQNNGSGNLIWITPNLTKYVIQRRTTTVQDLNQVAAALVTWDITDMIDSINYTVVSNTTIRVLSTGRYELYVNIVETSGTNNTNLTIKMQINGVNTAGSARSFSRVAAACPDSSGSMTTYVNLNANDVITVTSQRSGSAGTVTAVSGESIWSIKSI